MRAKPLEQPSPVKIPDSFMSGVTPPSSLEPLASALGDDNTRLSITDTERALFAACFGKVINQILVEAD
jgi:hypothetical protein